jgi:hypothetical protein
LKFEITATVEVLERTIKELLLIADASFKFSGMDVVKRLLVNPWIFKVIDFKNAVGRNPA